MRTLATLGYVCFLFAFSCGSESNLAVESLPAPTGPGSGESNLTLGADGKLYLSWIEPENDGHAFKFSQFDQGQWSSPKVIARGKDWFVNWADVPAMSALSDGKTFFAHWLSKIGAHTYAYGVRVARSNDGGHTWGHPLSPHRDSTQTEHGFVSWAPHSASEAALVWLDGRETEGEEAHGHDQGGHGHEEGQGGAMTLRSAILTADGTLRHEDVIDERVCDCCPTDLVASADGSLLVVYRDRSEDEIRDIRIARYLNGSWSPGDLVHEDNWKIAGCPVNGPSIASAGNLVAVAWFTVDETDRGHVRVAFSRSGGAFEKPIEVAGPDPLGRVGLVLNPSGQAWVVWLEAIENGMAEVRVRGVEESGNLSEPIRVAVTSASRSSGVPRLALLGDDLYIAWTRAADENRSAGSDNVLTARIKGIKRGRSA